MISKDKIIENLIGIEFNEEFENNIIVTFEDFEEFGENYIIVSKDEINKHIDYQVYINHKDATIFCIKITNNKISEVWI